MLLKDEANYLEFCHRFVLPPYLCLLVNSKKLQQEAKIVVQKCCQVPTGDVQNVRH
jgi:hypothetical protein